MKAVIVEKGGQVHEVVVDSSDVGAIVRLNTFGGRGGVLRVFRYSAHHKGVPMFHEVEVQVIDRVPGEGRTTSPEPAPEKSPRCAHMASCPALLSGKCDC